MLAKPLYLYILVFVIKIQNLRLIIVIKILFRLFEKITHDFKIG